MSHAPRIRRTVPRLALKRDEAAEALGISPEHFDRHVKDDIPCVYSGSLRLYPVAALQAWIDDQVVPVGRRSA